jgi:hypothetical protein
MQREHDPIRELAYHLWKARGCPTGSPEQDWLDAERRLSGGLGAERQPSIGLGAERPLVSGLGAERPLASDESAAPRTTSDAVDDGLKDTFPASDPPASHLPDEPPANVESKWAAAGAPRPTSKRRATVTRRTPKPDGRK